MIQAGHWRTVTIMGSQSNGWRVALNHGLGEIETGRVDLEPEITDGQSLIGAGLKRGEDLGSCHHERDSGDEPTQDASDDHDDRLSGVMPLSRRASSMVSAIRDSISGN